jgi:hypothetical protein
VIYYVDIDDTICTRIDSANLNYENSKPLKERIEFINQLYDNGHTIVYWTARGTGTGIDWSKTTKKQFSEWGVKYHELRFGKPIYDLFIDDKNINSENFFNNYENDKDTRNKIAL